MEENMIKRNLEYIKIEWADIHHSRQQEWSALVVVAGIFFAIAQIDPDYPGNPLEAKAFLGLIGVLSALLGAFICWRHYVTLRRKTSMIANLERQIGIQYPMERAKVPVQILMFLLFGGITSAFVGMTLAYGAEAIGRKDLQPWAYLIGVGVSFIFLLCALLRCISAQRTKSYGFKHPFCAEMTNLEKCLEALGEVPLKLVAGGTVDRERVKEYPWQEAEWACEYKTTGIEKQVLLNRRDAFQFSLANARSKQGWHYHNDTFEVYVSDKSMSVEYEEPGNGAEGQSLQVGGGVLIVPPGISHKVSLEGRAFVFQATLTGQGLGNDKVLAKER